MKEIQTLIEDKRQLENDIAALMNAFLNKHQNVSLVECKSTPILSEVEGENFHCEITVTI